jgi:senataxin
MNPLPRAPPTDLQERDVIFFSCVRAGGRGGGVGFLEDVRRMNVGLTRARHCLAVIGNRRAFTDTKIR